MADIPLGRFLHSRCITTSSLFIPCFSTHKTFLSFPSVPYRPHNRTNLRRRRRRRPLYLCLPSEPTSPIQSSPDFDVVSTHEHSDGSFVFRFGDPAKVVKDDELGVSNSGLGERERDGEEEYNVVKILDGNHERKVIVKNIEKEVRTHDLSEVDYVGESDNSVVISSKSSSVIEEVNESSEGEIKVVDLTISASGIEGNDVLDGRVNAGKVETKEEILGVKNEVLEQEKVLVPSPSILLVSKNAEVVDGSSIMEDQTVTSELGDVPSELEIPIASLEVVEEKVDEECKPSLQTVSAETHPVVEESDVDAGHETNRETVEEARMQNEFNDGSDEIDMIEVMPTSTLHEDEPIFDEKVDEESVEESRDAYGTENLMTIVNSSKNLISEEEMSKDGVKSNNLIEPLDLDVNKTESSETAVNSQEAPAADLVLSSGASLLPHPSKALTGGEDAYFYCCQSWLGVADGAGQWSLEGIKPGIYALELMDNCEKVVSDCGDIQISSPEEALDLSVAKTQSPGSSTALIGHFDGQVLHVANIGDSGFIVLRNGSVFEKSSPMHHEFNLPLQVQRGDLPSQLAEHYRIDVDEGDVIVAATDGLLENLYEQEIASIVSKSLEVNREPEEIAAILATRAQEVGGSASSRSPYADAAQAAGYPGYTGGKMDDVAVIVSVVQKRSIPHSS